MKGSTYLSILAGAAIGTGIGLLMGFKLENQLAILAIETIISSAIYFITNVD